MARWLASSGMVNISALTGKQSSPDTALAQERSKTGFATYQLIGGGSPSGSSLTEMRLCRRSWELEAWRIPPGSAFRGEDRRGQLRGITLALRPGRGLRGAATSVRHSRLAVVASFFDLEPEAFLKFIYCLPSPDNGVVYLERYPDLLLPRRCQWRWLQQRFFRARPFE